MRIAKLIESGMLGGGANPMIIQDTFTGADATAINERAPAPLNKPGNSWVSGVGTWTISGNKAVASTIVSGAFQYATVDTGKKSVSIEMNVTVPNADNYAPGFIVRFIDSSHYYLLIYLCASGGTTSQLQVRKIDGGSLTTVASLDVTEPGVSETITMTCYISGDYFRFGFSGQYLTYIDSTGNTATKHGITEYRSTGATGYASNAFDNYSVTPAPETNSITLTSLTALPVALEQHGFEECGGLLYAVAGANGSSTALNTVYAYDPVANSWAEKTVLPASVQSPVLRSVGGKLYCIGGQGPAPLYTKIPDTYEYNPADNSWTKKADMPTAREDMGSCVIDGKIYVFGGLTNGGDHGTPVKVLEIYDPVANSWDATKADMPDYKMLGDFGASYGGKAYAISSTNTIVGYGDLTSVGTVYMYDPATDEWETKAEMPLPRCYKECAVIGSKIYVFGGATTNVAVCTNIAYAYDCIEDTWAQMVSLPFSARGIGVAEYNGSIYISGGFGAATLATVYKLTV